MAASTKSFFLICGPCWPPFGIHLNPWLSQKAGIYVGLLEGWLQESSDPDKAAVTWLKQGAPLGLQGDIPTCGIFPPSDGPSAAILASQAFWEDACLGQVGSSNYKSFEDAGVHALKEVSRLEASGFADLFPTWEDVTSLWPKAVVSKVAVILKPRDDGDVKVRFVLDFRRSGVNGQL
eukprot:5423372-Amphidinium_carterae.1